MGSKQLPAPLPGSYWLVPGQLLAGEYPGSLDDDEARTKLGALLDAGITSFIDLTEVRDPLEPYEHILEDLARERGIEVCYERIPIRDMSIPTTDVMLRILRTVQSQLDAGRPVYFHCWGGIGRTGTVAACWLVEQGHTCDRALEMLKELRASLANAWQDSPQTARQVQFVRGWRAEPRRDKHTNERPP